ncbi:SET domain-containing protein [Fragilaria crotonensis]|nr:SET domain-containing protein [Fragilaria crotonensis]
MGKLVGWRIRVWDTKAWRDGRIVLYDSYTNKHKVQMNDKFPGLDETQTIWLRLIHETVQYAVRLVWAHVKGFAWWPAMVMDGDALDGVTQKKGHVLVNFFVTNEVSSLKDCSESIRPFGGGKVDDVISKHKKKRNTHAIQVAKEEETHIIKVRNNACIHYATKSFGIVNHRGHRLLGRRIEIHRPDVNYPYGDTVVGTVRQYSLTNKKWLVAFEPSAKTKNKYLAAWMNLANTNSKECSSLKFLEKKKVHEPTEYDLLPFLYGFECVDVRNSQMSHDDELISKLMKERCRACVDLLSHDHKAVACSKCGGAFHIGCIESDNTPGKHTGDEWICSRCIPCKGCWQHDVAFGVHIYSSSSSNLTLPGDAPLLLCSLCSSLYERNQYCPNCCHTWDDERYQRVHNRSYDSPFIKGGGGRGRKRKNSDDDIGEELEMDPSVPVEADWYHPDTNVWGYTAGNMLGCDDCGLWVHAGCSGLSREDYDRTSSGKHPIYSKEFLCRLCCRKRCNEIVDALREDDRMLLFAIPVTEDVAPTYHDIIKKPMDLQTIAKKASEGHYWNYAWVREDFELMVLNALTLTASIPSFGMKRSVSITKQWITYLMREVKVLRLGCTNVWSMNASAKRRKRRKKKSREPSKMRRPRRRILLLERK